MADNILDLILAKLTEKEANLLRQYLDANPNALGELKRELGANSAEYRAIISWVDTIPTSARDNTVEDIDKSIIERVKKPLGSAVTREAALTEGGKETPGEGEPWDEEYAATLSPMALAQYKKDQWNAYANSGDSTIVAFKYLPPDIANEFGSFMVKNPAMFDLDPIQAVYLYKTLSDYTDPSGTRIGTSKGDLTINQIASDWARNKDAWYSAFTENEKVNEEALQRAYNPDTNTFGVWEDGTRKTLHDYALPAHPTAKLMVSPHQFDVTSDTGRAQLWQAITEDRVYGGAQAAYGAGSPWERWQQSREQAEYFAASPQRAEGMAAGIAPLYQRAQEAGARPEVLRGVEATIQDVGRGAYALSGLEGQVMKDLSAQLLRATTEGMQQQRYLSAEKLVKQFPEEYAEFAKGVAPSKGTGRGVPAYTIAEEGQARSIGMEPEEETVDPYAEFAAYMATPEMKKKVEAQRLRRVQRYPELSSAYEQSPEAMSWAEFIQSKPEYQAYVRRREKQIAGRQYPQRTRYYA